MEVIILGSRSNDCLELKRRVITALDELGVDSNVYIEEDAGKILSYEVETPPAVLFPDFVNATPNKISPQNYYQIISR